MLGFFAARLLSSNTLLWYIIITGTYRPHPTPPPPHHISPHRTVHMAVRSNENQWIRRNEYTT